MQNTESTDQNPVSPTAPLLREKSARRLLIGAFALLVAIQALYLKSIGNGLGKLSDGFSEANVVRAVDAYLKDGLTSYHSLPRSLYGTRFPGEGTVLNNINPDGTVVAEMRIGFPERLAHHDSWVYTHYPQGPELLCGVMAYSVGLDPLWILRLLPLTFSLAAAAVFFQTLARVFGTDRAALIATGCVLLPMFNTGMPSLHYQGYSFALLLLQFSLLIHLWWRATRLRPWHWCMLFLFGFLQGWLSFDQFFVITLLPWPMWLLRRQEGARPSIRWLGLFMCLPLIGFGLAHLLHFLQVAAELGGLHAALDEFRRTAAERAGKSDILLPQTLQALLGRNTGHFGYVGSVILAAYSYLREVLILRGLQFGPLMLAAMVAVLPVLFFRKSKVVVNTFGKPRQIVWWLSWPGSGSVLPLLAAAGFVSVAWLLVMPAHVVGNSHITVRHLFVFYFFLVLTLVKSIGLSRDSSDGIAGAAGGTKRSES